MENIKYYKKNFLSSGVANYSDCDEGILLLLKPAIDNALKTIINKPVIIGHDGKTQVGEVVDAYFNTDTGNYVCGFIVWDEEAKKLLDNDNQSISCSYEVLNYGGSGKYHNIDYDEEAKEIQFIDLAIVDNPRYQEARQYVNSIVEEKKEDIKNNEIKTMRIKDLLKKIKLDNSIKTSLFKKIKSLKNKNIVDNGGDGSGNWGHTGLKGVWGGSPKMGRQMKLKLKRK